MGLKPEDLNVFQLVAGHRSVTGAAVELQMAQQSVSDRIRVLERVVGEPLFVRSPRGMELTAAGLRLLPYAGRCLNILDEALAAARSSTRGESTNMLVHPAWMEALAVWTDGLGRDKSFAVREHPGATDGLVQALLNGTADVSIGPIRTMPEEVTAVTLFVDPLVCVIPVGSPLVRQTELRMKELLVGELATRRPSHGQECIVTSIWADPEASTMALSLTDRLPNGGFDEGDSPKQWVATFCPRSLVAEDIEHEVVVELAVEGIPPWSIEVVAAFRTADRDQPSIVALYDVLDAARSVLGFKVPSSRP